MPCHFSRNPYPSYSSNPQLVLYNQKRWVGLDREQSFFRFDGIPAMGHCFGVGSVNECSGISPPADPPLPAPGQPFQLLPNWVEQGLVPESIMVSNNKGVVSRSLYVFPKTIVYVGGDIALAEQILGAGDNL